jgi:OFA family oxalate/formate antiporter-like MFS transporter
MLATPVFWLMYAMMTMVTVGGLMATAQLAPMAESFGVADYPLNILGTTVPALTLAASLDRILNGLTRPFFGWVSDRVGRERTMGLAFTLEAGAIFLLVRYAHVPWLFVLFTGLTYFGWGEIYSLFPALCGDLFGRRYAATNYALLYTAKGTAALMVPLGSWLYRVNESWIPVFGLAIAFDLLVAFLAVFVLQPLHRRWTAWTPAPDKAG